MKKRKKKSGNLDDCISKKLVVNPSEESTNHEVSLVNNQESANTRDTEEQQKIREALLKCLKS
jgi:hypothetical protein